MSPDDLLNVVAKWWLALVLGGASAWKLRNRLRSDNRVDAAEQTTVEMYQGMVAQFVAQVARLEGQIARLDAQALVLNEHLTAAGVRVNEEVHRRYIAENQLRRAETNVGGLEAEIAGLTATARMLEEQLAQFRAGELP